jgi:hypothetical protein
MAVMRSIWIPLLRKSQSADSGCLNSIASFVPDRKRIILLFSTDHATAG